MECIILWSFCIGIQNRTCPSEAAVSTRVLRVRQPHLNIGEIESLDGSEVSARWVLGYKRNNKTDVFSVLIFKGNGTMIRER